MGPLARCGLEQADHSLIEAQPGLLGQGTQLRIDFCGDITDRELTHDMPALCMRFMQASSRATLFVSVGLRAECDWPQPSSSNESSWHMPLFASREFS
jgi:hypothetical protein